MAEVLIGQAKDTRTIVRGPTTDGYNMERTISYCYGCSHLGSALSEAEDLN